jgi:hypothetical protein
MLNPEVYLNASEVLAARARFEELYEQHRSELGYPPDPETAEFQQSRARAEIVALRLTDTTTQSSIKTP